MTDYRKKSSIFFWGLHIYAQTYYEMFLSEVTLIFEQATELININRDAALEKIYDIDRAGECTKKTITLGKIKNKQSVVWFRVLLSEAGEGATSPEKK